MKRGMSTRRAAIKTFSLPTDAANAGDAVEVRVTSHAGENMACA
jgi:hypothetical protein